MRLLTLIATATLGLAQPTARAEAAAACADFDSHVNGRWAAGTELPADRARIGNFDTLRIANDRLLEAALKELAAEPARQTRSGLRLLATHYRAGMDEAAIEQRGLAALQPLLARMDQAERADLPALPGELARLHVAAPLSIGVGTDAKDAPRHVLQLNQAGLGAGAGLFRLPQRRHPRPEGAAAARREGDPDGRRPVRRRAAVAHAG